MKTIKKALFASVLLASLGATSGVVIAAQKFDARYHGARATDMRDPFTDGSRSVTDPRDPFTDGRRIALGQADSSVLAAGVRTPDPFTDGARSVTDPRDPFTDGGYVAPASASAAIA